MQVLCITDMLSARWQCAGQAVFHWAVLGTGRVRMGSDAVSHVATLSPHDVCREAQQAQRRAMQQAAKADSLAQKASAAAAKEDDRMAAFRALAAAGPITIPKRA